MIFTEKKITLKNGTTAILKTPEIKDAEMMLKLIKTASGETDFLVRYKEDWEETTVEGEEKWIKSNRESEKDYVISCYIDGNVVGCCEISFMDGSKTFHRAGIGISVLKKYWNIGIGTAMFSEIITLAEKHQGTEIAELEYIEGNDRARALYEKFGFKEVCVKPKAYKLRNGAYQNSVYMQKIL